MPRNLTLKDISKYTQWVYNKFIGLTPLQGAGMLITKKTNGYLFEVDRSNAGGGAGGTGSYPCITTGAYSGGKVPVDVYKNGLDQPKTGTGDLYVMQLHISSDIPIGTKMMGFDTSLVNYNDEE